jgi:predicted MFS family arabinose efflux permease
LDDRSGDATSHILGVLFVAIDADHLADRAGGQRDIMMRVRWDMGLGRDLGYAFWATTCFEGIFGAYTGIWPLWIEHLGAPIAIVGLVLGVAGVIRPFILGPSAWLSERFDPRKMLMTARVIAFCGLIVAALAQSWPILLLTVVTNAIGELVFPLMQTYAADKTTTDRVRAFTLIFTVGPSAALIICPLLVGVLIAIWGMRAAFIFAALLTLAAIWLISRLNFRTPEHAAPPSVPTGGYGAVFRHHASRQILILHGATVFVLAIGVSLVPNFLHDVRGIDPALIATLGAGAAVGTVTYGLVISRSPRIQRAPFLGATAGVGAVALALIIFTALGSLPAVTIAFVLRGGFFSAWALFMAALGETAPGSIRSRSFATMEILGGSAMSFGPVVAAQLYGVEPTLPLIVSAAGAAILIPIIVHGHRDQRRYVAAQNDEIDADALAQASQ